MILPTVCFVHLLFDTFITLLDVVLKNVAHDSICQNSVVATPSDDEVTIGKLLNHLESISLILDFFFFDCHLLFWKIPNGRIFCLSMLVQRLDLARLDSCFSVWCLLGCFVASQFCQESTWLHTFASSQVTKWFSWWRPDYKDHSLLAWLILFPCYSKLKMIVAK